MFGKRQGNALLDKLVSDIWEQNAERRSTARDAINLNPAPMRVDNGLRLEHTDADSALFCGLERPKKTTTDEFRAHSAAVIGNGHNCPPIPLLRADAYLARITQGFASVEQKVGKDFFELSGISRNRGKRGEVRTNRKICRERSDTRFEDFVDIGEFRMEFEFLAEKSETPDEVVYMADTLGNPAKRVGPKLLIIPIARKVLKGESEGGSSVFKIVHEECSDGLERLHFLGLDEAL